MRRCPAEAEDEIIARLRQIVPRVQGVIVADQVQERNCGVITDRVRDEIASLARAYPTTLFAADSRERIGLFRDVIIKPNAREATRALYPDRETELDRAGVEACGAELYRRNGKPVFLTLGADGIVVFHADGPTHVPACPVHGPIDIVGAGDCDHGRHRGRAVLRQQPARSRAGRQPGRFRHPSPNRHDRHCLAPANRRVLLSVANMNTRP